jgi:hypothetical protein
MLRGLSVRVVRAKIMLCSFLRLLVLVGFWVVLDCLWVWADVYGLDFGYSTQNRRVAQGELRGKR